MRRSLTSAAALAACVVIIALIHTRADFTSAPPSLLDSPTSHLRTIQLENHTIRVSVADTPLTREKGLGGRGGLAGDEGMLFVFLEDGKYAFWMKDMRFSIDILWLSAEGVIVDMRENVSPETYPSLFEPQALARYVLELPAGYAKGYDLHIGDVVRL